MVRRIHILTLIAVLFCLLTPVQAQRKVSVIQDIINQVNSDSLMYFVKELSGVVPTIIGGQPYTITSRNKSYPGNDKATEYLKQKLESYGMQASIQTFSTTGKNTIGIQTGTTFPNQKYMICAHMDCMPTSATAPGADDNGSGTAAVIEAARILRNYSFPFSIVYALWDEEEQGLVGSAYYANAASAAGDSILGVINLDMISWERNNDNKVNIHTRPTANSLDLSSKMIELNTVHSIGLLTNIKNPGITASDHASFWNKNISAILLIEDDDNDFNAYYHTANDKYTEFNIPYFKKCSQLAIATLASFALNLNIQIAHTPQPSLITNDKLNIYASLLSGLNIGTGISAPRIYYRVNQGGGYGQFLSEAGIQTSPGNFLFGLPKMTIGSAVQYYIAGQDAQGQIVVTSPKGGSGFNPPGSTPPPSFHQFYIAPQMVKLSDNATSATRWTAAGGPWGTTTTKYISPPSSFTESPAGQYGNSVTATFTYNENISLSSSLGAVLEFDTQYELEDKYDYIQVQLSTDNGSTWVPLSGQYTKLGSGSFQPNGQPLYNGAQMSWVHEKMDLSAFYGRTFKLRFFFKSDGSVPKDGFYVDNIVLSTYSTVAYDCYLYDVKSANGKVTLNWNTGGETGIHTFVIERSPDGMLWNDAGVQNPAGSAGLSASYTFTDDQPANGLNYYRIKSVTTDGSVILSDIMTTHVDAPVSYSLSQNYPNPFNPATTIKYGVGSEKALGNRQQALVSLNVYDVLGREVATLVNEEQAAGNYEVKFDAAVLPSGTYFYELRAGEFRAVKKMILLR